jgi:transposase InsO family protein
MGLKGAGSYFQAKMTEIIGPELLYNRVEVYLDDVIVWGATEREYLDNLKALMKRFALYGVRLSPKKCRFGLAEVEYVGHVINSSGRTFSDAKRRKVVDFPKPTLHRHMKGFLGLINYMRDAIPNMSTFVQPLQAMVSQYKKGTPLKWTPALEQRFEEVKAALGDCQTLFWMDETLPVFLHTDASDYGCGGYLFQKDETGKEFPIQFLSKSFSAVQRRWSTIEKECYGLWYCVTQLEHLLRDRHFTLRTDHRNLLYLNNQASPKIVRWKLSIQEYSFDIQHIAGPLNIVADAMSRLCPEDGNPPPVTSETVALCMAVFANPGTLIHCNARTATAASARRSTQRFDAAMLKELASCHNDITGHFARDRTAARMSELAARTGSSCWQTDKERLAAVEQYVASCPTCQRLSQVKRPRVDSAYTISSTMPMEKIAVDTLGPFPPDADGRIYIIVVIDCFSRYVELFPATDCTAEAAAHAMVEHFSTFGVPKYLLTDNGPQFANQLIGQFAKRINMDLLKSIAYSHEENGIVERANKEVLRHLRALFDSQSDTPWSILTPLVKRIMNATVHSSTGFAPAAVLMPGLDLDEGLIFPHKADNDDPLIVSEYLRTLDSKQADIVRRVQLALGNRFAKNKRKFDATNAHRQHVFPDGAYVLLDYPDKIRPPSKLNMPRMGPYQVLSHKGAKYEVVNLVTGKTLFRHISQLSEFNATRCSPTEVATRNTSAYLVQEVLSHTGTPAKKAQMRFTVRWLGYGPGDDTQEPWKVLQNNWVFHQYCRQQNLHKLIPAAFQDVDLPTPTSA